MLRALSIRNLAVIEHLDVEFGSGLNVLTGETGSGKSVVVAALGLIGGARAGAELVRAGAAEAQVDARFEPPPEVWRLLGPAGVAPAPEIEISRILPVSGRGRVTVNGEALALTLLREVAGLLFSITGQHASRELVDPDSHVLCLDRYAGLDRQREEYRAAWEGLREARQSVERIDRALADRQARAEYLDYRIAEIRSLGTDQVERERLERERSLLANGRALQEIAGSSHRALYAGEPSIHSGLWSVISQLEKARRLTTAFDGAREGLAEAAALIEDAARRIDLLGEEITLDPVRLERIEERLFAIQRLERKYGRPLAELSELLAGMEIERAALDSAATDREVWLARAREHEGRLAAGAVSLAAARAVAATRFDREVEAGCVRVGMQAARFVTRRLPLEDARGTLEVDGCLYGPDGSEEIEFLAQPNPGEELRPIGRILSGGELSRLLLVLRALIRRSAGSPTLVFDEVDSGIGGMVAVQVGTLLREISAGTQVVAITHLPQIATQADVHLSVSKRVAGGRTTVAAVRLDREEERRRELVRMTGGTADGAAKRLRSRGGQGIKKNLETGAARKR